MEDGYIKVGWIEFLEGGFAAATVLISFGVVLGKTSPNQLLVMSIIECGLFVGNSYIGYNILGALDIGKQRCIFCFLFLLLIGLDSRPACFQKIILDVLTELIRLESVDSSFDVFCVLF